MNARVLGVVPARIASTRLPDKPLFPILGRPLVEWVWRRVRSMSALDHAVVATDSDEVARVCRALGAPVEMTSSDHPSGTDRVAEVAARGPYRRYPVIVNVQGDEPLVEERHLATAVELVRERGWEIGTCATPVARMEAWTDPSVVKVVRASSGRALYFSRAAIPRKRSAEPDEDDLAREPYLRHIGIYACARDALERWAATPPTSLERLEKLEQLRPLESGVRIGVAVVGSAHPGVDTPADARRTERRLREMERRSSSLASGT